MIGWKSGTDVVATDKGDTMKFIVFVHPGDKEGYKAGKMPDEKALEAMTKYNEELVNAGVMLGGEGVHPDTDATRIHFSGADKMTITDGPFTQTGEVIGGFWVWQVKSKAEAVEWAKRAPMEVGATLEIRQCFEPEDFGPEIAARERAMIEKIEKQQNR